MDKIALKTEDLTLPVLARLGRLEYRLCITINRLSRRQAMHRLFRTVSRLGDGVFWYCLMAALALLGGEVGREAALRMGIAGLGGLIEGADRRALDGRQILVDRGGWGRRSTRCGRSCGGRRRRGGGSHLHRHRESDVAAFFGHPLAENDAIVAALKFDLVQVELVHQFDELLEMVQIKWTTGGCGFTRHFDVLCVESG